MKHETITLAHGNGGQMMQELIKKTIVPTFGGQETLTDGAVLRIGESEIVFSTDSFTVNPIFFPGGDIGSLAVHGTVNDVTAMGATPLYLSCAAVIEEGFPVADLERILKSMGKACRELGVQIVTGDTKVVEKGSADGTYLNTAGIGVRRFPLSPRFGQIKSGDTIVISGTVGDHGTAIALARNDLGLSNHVQSDCASLYPMIEPVLKAGLDVVIMRDPTRGGLATVLNEFVDGQALGIEVDQRAVPVHGEVKAVCEILGYDPLYLANEGKMVFVVSDSDTDALLTLLHRQKLGREASVIGRVTDRTPGKVVLKTEIGGTRILDMLVYDQLPRIC